MSYCKRLSFFIIYCCSFIIGMISLNAWAMQDHEIKTIEQMNARLDSLYGSHDDYHAFFDKIKTAVGKKDKKTVAALVKYPLKANIRHQRVTIKNQQQFIQNYDAIITPKVQKVVAEQEFIGMFSNWRGMMFGNGQLWFSEYCLDKTCTDPRQKHIYITVINN